MEFLINIIVKNLKLGPWTDEQKQIINKIVPSDFKDIDDFKFISYVGNNIIARISSIFNTDVLSKNSPKIDVNIIYEMEVEIKTIQYYNSIDDAAAVTKADKDKIALLYSYIRVVRYVIDVSKMCSQENKYRVLQIFIDTILETLNLTQTSTSTTN